MGAWAERELYSKRRLRSKYGYDIVRPTYLDEERLERIAQKLHDGAYGQVRVDGDKMFYQKWSGPDPGARLENLTVDLGPGGGEALMAIYNNNLYYQSRNDWYNNHNWVSSSSAATYTYTMTADSAPAKPAKKETVLEWLEKQTEEICKLARVA